MYLYYRHTLSVCQFLAICYKGFERYEFNVNCYIKFIIPTKLKSMLKTHTCVIYFFGTMHVTVTTDTNQPLASTLGSEAPLHF